MMLWKEKDFANPLKLSEKVPFKYIFTQDRLTDLPCCSLPEKSEVFLVHPDLTLLLPAPQNLPHPEGLNQCSTQVYSWKPVCLKTSPTVQY